jgi:excisionase family DNA binding protein
MAAKDNQQLQFPQLVDIETLAGLLGTSIRHLRHLVAKEKIPYLKVVGVLRFDLAEVLAWLEEQRHPAKGERTPRVAKRRPTPC